MTFDNRISPRLIGNRVKKKRGSIFEIKCSDTTVVSARTVVVRHTNIKKIVAMRYHRGCF